MNQIFNIEKVKKLIDNYDYVSFDIFDTLTTRPTLLPTDFFYFIQQKINDSNDNLYLPFDFLNERIIAEKIQREKFSKRGKSPDYLTLKDIYKQVAKRQLLDAKTTEKIYNCEVEQEVEWSIKYELGAELYNYALKRGKKIIIISDMYLPIDAVRKILKRLGYDKYTSLIVSSEDGLCKSDGSVFAYLLGKKKINNKSLIHIGDNPASDYAMAQGFGIQAVKMPKKDELIAPQHIMHFKSLNEIGLTARTGVLESISAFNRSENLDNDSFWWGLGNEVASHLILGFNDWIVEETRKAKFDKLLFLARDGQILHKAFGVYEKHNGKVADSAYCYASRRLFNVASIDKMTSSDVDFILSGTTPLTPRQYLERINLLNQQTIKLVTKQSIHPDQMLDAVAMQRMRSVIWELSEDIEKQAEAERKKLIKYFEALGIEGKKIGVVDVGWHGSMQHSLEKIFKLENFKVDLYGLYFGLHSNAQINDKMLPYLYEEDKGTLYQKTIRQSVEVVELMFSADHPSIIGVNNNKAIYGPKVPRMIDVESLHLGVLSFIEKYYSINFGIDLTSDACLQGLARLISFPSRAEAFIIGSVPHVESFGYNNKIRARYIAMAPNWYYFFASRRKWRKARDESYWKNGFAKQVESMFLFRVRRKIIKVSTGIYRKVPVIIRQLIPLS